MKKGVFTVLFIITMCFLLAIPLKAGSPKWKTDHDTDKYLIGVGQGASYEEAISRARADLIAQISVNITSQSVIDYSAFENSKYAGEQISLEQHIKTSAEQQISGVDVAERIKTGKTFYVKVVLSKQIMLRNLATEISDLHTKIVLLLDNAEKYKNEGQILFAFQGYHDIYSNLSELTSKRILYYVFSGQEIDIPDLIHANEIDFLAKKLASSIRFKVVDGDKQTATVYKTLPKPVVFQAIISKDKKEGALPGLPIKVLYGDGELIKNGVTTLTGEYSLPIIAKPYIENKGKVIIKLDIDRFPDFYEDILKDIATEASFTVQEEQPLPITLKVSDLNGKNIPAIKSELSQVLRNNKLIDKPNSPIYLKADITNQDISQVGGRYQTTINVSIEIGVSKTKEVLGMKEITLKGMSSVSSSQAANDAIKSIVHHRDTIDDLVKRAGLLELGN
ncbi:MAG TPA: LPP20 family lipoprotein [Candidatus Cloacimonadota bacterium]|nr:LPP20 family lipoprotein [Candidatus Cloacimonadota bacterium]HPY97307.1 LPP20 family lipoprotein [Candidatus Cloacimonadota bacterium]HQB41842.1 LPP20 family lipoprotein [Candidatus Cloacimonadota bacterium]